MVRQLGYMKANEHILLVGSVLLFHPISVSISLKVYGVQKFCGSSWGPPPIDSQGASELAS